MGKVQETQNQWDAVYKEYLNSLKTGDTVYPAYDAKSCRATACKITAASKEYIRVEGIFWDSNDDQPAMVVFDRATGWAKQNADLLESAYLLLHPQCFVRDPRHSRKYLESLGFSETSFEEYD